MIGLNEEVFRFFTTLFLSIRGEFSSVADIVTLVVAAVSEVGVCSEKLVVA